MIRPSRRDREGEWGEGHIFTGCCPKRDRGQSLTRDKRTFYIFINANNRKQRPLLVVSVSGKDGGVRRMGTLVLKQLRNFGELHRWGSEVCSFSEAKRFLSIDISITLSYT